VTLGYERITGARLPNQASDGTFTANKTRTVVGDETVLRKSLVEDRRDLFPGVDTALRSKIDAKTVRLAIGPGVASIFLDPAPPDRVRVTVMHERLPDSESVAEWKDYWSEWLAAIDEAGGT
jgi:hypothetical protein